MLKTDMKIESCTQQDVELHVEQVRQDHPRRRAPPPVVAATFSPSTQCPPPQPNQCRSIFAADLGSARLREFYHFCPELLLRIYPNSFGPIPSSLRTRSAQLSQQLKFPRSTQ